MAIRLLSKTATTSKPVKVALVKVSPETLIAGQDDARLRRHEWR
jgi:hypothetical protein